MLYISAQDFFEKVSSFSAMSPQEEMACAERMKEGSAEARQRLIQSYLPAVAGYIKRQPPKMQTLRLVFTCVQALEKAVDSFDFLQAREPFSRRLSLYLRQAVTRYIAG